MNWNNEGWRVEPQRPPHECDTWIGQYSYAHIIDFVSWMTPHEVLVSKSNDDDCLVAIWRKKEDNR